MIKITARPISPQQAVDLVRTPGSGCVAVYVGLIRDTSRGKKVLSVEYRDADGQATARLEEMAAEIMRRWPMHKISICHRIGMLRVGDVNLVVAVSAAHRREAFAAARFAVDSFKKNPPTSKNETYVGGVKHRKTVESLENA
jgi:molybdopterin synthase catalytic subunit